MGLCGAEPRRPCLPQDHRSDGAAPVVAKECCGFRTLQPGDQGSAPSVAGVFVAAVYDARDTVDGNTVPYESRHRVRHAYSRNQQTAQPRVQAERDADPHDLSQGVPQPSTANNRAQRGSTCGLTASGRPKTRPPPVCASLTGEGALETGSGTASVRAVLSSERRGQCAAYSHSSTTYRDHARIVATVRHRRRHPK